MRQRDQKQKPIPDRRIKERIIRGAPYEPLTPGLRKESVSTHAIGFIHDFDAENGDD